MQSFRVTSILIKVFRESKVDKYYAFQVTVLRIPKYAEIETDVTIYIFVVVSDDS